MTFALKGNGTSAEWLSFRFSSLRIKLRPLVAQHFFTIDVVDNQRIAQRQHFYPHPLIATKSFGMGADAMVLDYFPSLNELRSGRAKIRRRSLAIAHTPQQLHFHGNRKFLILAHGCRILAVDHDAAVAKSPARSSFDLLAGKAIFRRQQGVRVRLPIEEMAKLPVKFFVFVIPHLDKTVVHPERISKILTQFVGPDLHLPSAEVFTIEQLLPF